jgi:hypothetical protein
MPILGAVVVFIQLCFAYHAMKTGRPTWWLFVIMGFPVMGCVLYYFIEVFPTTRESRAAEKAVRSIVKSFDPDKDLRNKVADLESCGSVANRISLAQECASRNMYEEAAALYRSCLTGINANDPDILHGLAHVLVLQSLHEAALPIIRQLGASHPGFRPQEVRMLLAEALEGTGDLELALAEYGALAQTYPGEEGRWRYGALLKRLGRNEEAMAVFQDMLKRAQRQPGHYRDAQRKWLDLAAENSR